MLETRKDSIYMYTFYHASGASIQVMELEGEGWILAPAILEFFGYEHPLRELEDVDEDDIRYVQGVPFINKYVFKRFAYQALPPKMDEKQETRYYFREEERLREFCYWVSHVAISVMRGTSQLPDDDDEWDFDIWRKDKCKRYMKEVKEKEGIFVEEEVTDQTITIPIYTHSLDELNLDSEKLLFLHKIFCEAYDTDMDLKSFANGFVFAMGLVDHWEQEIIEMLEEKPIEIQA